MRKVNPFNVQIEQAVTIRLLHGDVFCVCVKLQILEHWLVLTFVTNESRYGSANIIL